jgi:hypothetical protein
MLSAKTHSQIFLLTTCSIVKNTAAKFVERIVLGVDNLSLLALEAS